MCVGAKSVLCEDQLLKQDHALLATLSFLSLCSSSERPHGLAFKPADVRRRLLKLLDHLEFARPLHLHLVSSPGPGGSSGGERERRKTQRSVFRVVCLDVCYRTRGVCLDVCLDVCYRTRGLCLDVYGGLDVCVKGG